MMPDRDQIPLFRMIDASLNRAAEGLRSLEEIARFVLADSTLTSQLKSLRHDLQAATATLSRQSLLEARDTESDVGTSIRGAGEYHRSNLLDILIAAASRTQQSLRVIEEASKAIDSRIATSVEQIRYQSYTICSHLEQRCRDRSRRDRLVNAHLYVLIDAARDSSAFCQIVEQLCEAGVDVLQLRDREHDDRTLIERARLGTEIARRHDAIFIMNDRADLALAAETDGVHLGQEELPVEVARQILGADKLIGVSTHELTQALQAVEQGADYIGCGPIFSGRTKTFDSYLGTNWLKTIAGQIDIPAFAIGGIDHTNVDQVVDAGINRIAVTGAIRDAADPAQAAAELRRRLTGESRSSLAPTGPASP